MLDVVINKIGINVYIMYIDIFSHKMFSKKYGGRKLHIKTIYLQVPRNNLFFKAQANGIILYKIVFKTAKKYTNSTSISCEFDLVGRQL